MFRVFRPMCLYVLCGRLSADLWALWAIFHRSRTCSGAPHLLPVDWPFTGRPESTRQTTQNRGRMKTPENNEQQQQANYQNRSFYLK